MILKVNGVQVGHAMEVSWGSMNDSGKSKVRLEKVELMEPFEFDIEFQDGRRMHVRADLMTVDLFACETVFKED